MTLSVMDCLNELSIKAYNLTVEYQYPKNYVIQNLLYAQGVRDYCWYKNLHKYSNKKALDMALSTMEHMRYAENCLSDLIK